MKIAKPKKVVEKNPFVSLWSGTSLLDGQTIIFPDQTTLDVKDIRIEDDAKVDIFKIKVHNEFFLNIDGDLYDWEWYRVFAEYVKNKENYHEWKWRPLYSTRFNVVEKFNRYTETACVYWKGGWFHINLLWEPLYPEKYGKVYDFQPKRKITNVVAFDNRYLVIDMKWNIIPPKN